MVIYFTKSGATKNYAECISALTDQASFELKSKKESGLFLSVIKSFFGVGTEVTALPNISKEKSVFICSPVWGASVTPAVRYFIEHVDFGETEVNFLLTCSSINQELYSKRVMKLLNKRKCKVGTIHIFAVDRKNPLTAEEMKEQLKGLIE